MSQSATSVCRDPDTGPRDRGGQADCGHPGRDARAARIAHDANRGVAVPTVAFRAVMAAP
jgi:hypothetical protein